MKKYQVMWEDFATGRQSKVCVCSNLRAAEWVAEEENETRSTGRAYVVEITT